MTGSDDGAAAGEEMALEPTAEENALLVSIADPDLREALLLGVLRSPPGESVLVQVNVRMAESDGFCGARLPELLQNGMFEDAYLHRAGCEAVMSFELTCPACPALSRSYVGDDVQDKLLEFFAKELIRFKPSTCMQEPLEVELARQGEVDTNRAKKDDSMPLKVPEVIQVEGIDPCRRAGTSKTNPLAESDVGAEGETSSDSSGGVSEDSEREDPVNDNHVEPGAASESAAASDELGAHVADTLGSSSQHGFGGGDDQPDCVSIQVGDRLHIPREDPMQACTASIIAVKHDGPTVVTYDDMFWAAFPSDDLLELLRLGTIWKVADRDDLAPDLRARVFLRPCNGAPPHCFLFGEAALLEAAASAGWRWFGKLMPAPPNGTFAQKYSPPGIGGPIVAGSRIKLSGRVAKLIPAKRCEPREPLNTETPFVLLGFVQANLPTQKSYWGVVHSRSHGSMGNTYVTSIFGKGGESHVTLFPEDTMRDIVDDAKLQSLTMAAKELLASRTPVQMNGAIAMQKPLPQLGATISAAQPLVSMGKTRAASSAPSAIKSSAQCKRKAISALNGGETLEGQDPFPNNFELTGVGKSRLSDLTAPELVFMLKARQIKHKQNATIPQLIQKLELWKRDRSQQNRRSGKESSRDENTEDDEDNEAGEEQCHGPKRSRNVDVEPLAPPVVNNKRRAAGVALVELSKQRTTSARDPDNNANKPIVVDNTNTVTTASLESLSAERTKKRINSVPSDSISCNSVSVNSVSSNPVSSTSDQTGVWSVGDRMHHSKWHGVGVGDSTTRSKHDDRSYEHQHSLGSPPMMQRQCYKPPPQRFHNPEVDFNQPHPQGFHPLDFNQHAGDRHRLYSGRDSAHPNRSSIQNNDQHACRPDVREHEQEVPKVALLPPGWKTARDHEGNIYYYNKVIGRSQYVPPDLEDYSPPLPPPRAIPQYKRASPLKAPLFQTAFMQGPDMKFHIKQLQRERARLKGMVPHMSGVQKAEIYGEIAAIESELFSLQHTDG